METNKTSQAFDFGWLPHIVILTAALVTLSAGFAAVLVLRNQPAAHAAPAPFHMWTVTDAREALRAAGLEAEIIHGGPRDERDGFASMMQVESVRLLIPSEGQSRGGMLLSFYNAQDLQKMLNYYAGLNKSLPQFKSWVYVRDNVLLQLNGDIPEATANKYGAALNALDVR